MEITSLINLKFIYTYQKILIKWKRKGEYRAVGGI